LGNPSDVSIIVSVEYPIFSVNFENYLDTIFVLKRVSNVPTPMDVHLYNPYPNSFKVFPFINFRVGFLRAIPSNGKEVTDWLLGASVGGEYFFDNNFSFGIES